MVDPPVVKTVSGDPAKASTFTFRLTADKPTNPMPAGSKDGVKDLQITGSGKGEFGTWSYTAEGTYYYTVSEVNTGEKGYTYDTTVYTITDAVKAVDGQLVVTRVVTNGANKQVTSLSFINTYTSGDGGNSDNGGNSNGGGKPGSDGPKMGDDTNFTLYIILFGLGGLLVIRTMVYLIVCRKRKKAGG
jgi:pilin isopeptide linkage protein